MVIPNIGGLLLSSAESELIQYFKSLGADSLNSAIPFDVETYKQSARFGSYLMSLGNYVFLIKTKDARYYLDNLVLKKIQDRARVFIMTICFIPLLTAIFYYLF